MIDLFYVSETVENYKKAIVEYYMYCTSIRAKEMVHVLNCKAIDSIFYLFDLKYFRFNILSEISDYSFFISSLAKHKDRYIDLIVPISDKQFELSCNLLKKESINQIQRVTHMLNVLSYNKGVAYTKYYLNMVHTILLNNVVFDRNTHFVNLIDLEFTILKEDKVLLVLNDSDFKNEDYKDLIYSLIGSGKTDISIFTNVEDLSFYDKFKKVTEIENIKILEVI